VKVGIGTATPSSVLTIAQGAGHPVSDGWETFSSRRWKTNIQTLRGSLGKVEQLRGVSYDLKANGKHEVGVIAEEVGAVLPELVSYEENGIDARGVDYSRLTALLIEATKEQQTLIREQQEQLKAQRAQIARLASQVKTIQASLKASDRTGREIRRVKTQANLLPMGGVE
jgi:small-conductance mechanosensitive channel